MPKKIRALYIRRQSQIIQRNRTILDANHALQCRHHRQRKIGQPILSSSAAHRPHSDCRLHIHVQRANPSLRLHHSRAPDTSPSKHQNAISGFKRISLRCFLRLIHHPNQLPIRPHPYLALPHTQPPPAPFKTPSQAVITTTPPSPFPLRFSITQPPYDAYQMTETETDMLAGGNFVLTANPAASPMIVPRDKAAPSRALVRSQRPKTCRQSLSRRQATASVI